MTFATCLYIWYIGYVLHVIWQFRANKYLSPDTASPPIIILLIALFWFVLWPIQYVTCRKLRKEQEAYRNAPWKGP